MKYVRLSGRILINAATLNTQGAAGTNYVELTKVPVVLRGPDGSYILREVPAISGNMVKRYHFVGVIDFLRKTPFKNNLTEYGARYVAYRFPEREKSAKKPDGSSVDLSKGESMIIREFADADLHGYLVPVADIQSRRESICKFSFLLPVEEAILAESYGVEAVTHNRVILDEEGRIVGRETAAKAGAMMIFKRQYTSAPFGFSIILDLALTGVPLANPLKGSQIPEDERKIRSKAAVIALLNLLTGNTGANTSRAFPAEKVEELIAVASVNPIPPLVHGFYKDYAEQSANNLKHYMELTGETEGIRVFIYARNPSRVRELTKLFSDAVGEDAVKLSDSPVGLIGSLANYVIE